jgi:hypothetical protein
MNCNLLSYQNCDFISVSGADPEFQVRGGGALKKIAPSGGRLENLLGISCEKSRFYAKKIIIFPIAQGGAKIVGVFRVKNHDLKPKKKIVIPILGRARAACAPTPLDRPCVYLKKTLYYKL